MLRDPPFLSKVATGIFGIMMVVGNPVGLTSYLVGVPTEASEDPLNTLASCLVQNKGVNSIE